MFGAIKDIGNNMKQLNPNRLMRDVIDDSQLKAQIIDLNQSQMYDKGIDAKGETLGDYSQISVTKYGKRPGHIQLKDTGEFYDSMKVGVEEDKFVITGDTDKGDIDLANVYPDALGLTEDSKSEIIPEIAERLTDKIKTEILKYEVT